MNRNWRNFPTVFLLVFLSLSIGPTLFGQVSPVLKQRPEGTDEIKPKCEVVTLKLASKLMDREMSYQVVYPFSYKNRREFSKRYPVVYLLHGLTGHFDNWASKTKLANYAVELDTIIVTPEGDNGWYTDSSSVANDKYESYIIKELVPEIDGKFRTLADRDHRAIAGLSMGGYGAIKFGLKYPEMFSLVGSFSGALGAAAFTEKGAGNIGKTIDAIFGPVDGEKRKANDIFGLVRGLTPEKIKTLPFIYIDCGTEDFLFRNNRDFNNLLIEKKVPHEFRVLPGAHNWAFWDSQVQEFLRLAERRIKNTTVKVVSGPTG